MTRTYTGFDGETYTDEDARQLRESILGTKPAEKDVINDNQVQTSATAGANRPSEEPDK